MRTAIIDYGVDVITQKQYNNHTVCYEVKDKEIVASEPLHGVTHGSVCAEVFAKHAGKMPDVSICLSRDYTQKSNSDDLAKAMAWCANNGIKLISLSMGTTRFKDVEILRKAIYKLDNTGVTVVAAANNSGLITYPAVFDSCVGVSCSNSLTGGEIAYFEIPYDGINVITYPIESTKINVTGSNSISAAYIAGITCAELKDSVTPNMVRSFLSKASIKLDIDRTGLFLTERVKNCTECEPIIVLFITTSGKNETQFINDLHKCIIRDYYTCAVLLQSGLNIPSELRFSISSSPISPYDTLAFVSKICRPDIILSDSINLNNYADVVIEQELVSIKVSDSRILKIDLSTPNDLWTSIKEIYENH